MTTRSTAPNTKPDADIFEIWDSQTPTGTFAYYKGNEVKYNSINVLGNKTSVNRTSKFVKSQMPRIYGDAGKHKYSVSYLASNGK